MLKFSDVCACNLFVYNVGLDDFLGFFFPGNSLKLSSHSKLFFFCGLAFDFFLSSLHFRLLKEG